MNCTCGRCVSSQRILSHLDSRCNLQRAPAGAGIEDDFRSLNSEMDSIKNRYEAKAGNIQKEIRCRKVVASR